MNKTVDFKKLVLNELTMIGEGSFQRTWEISRYEFEMLNSNPADRIYVGKFEKYKPFEFERGRYQFLGEFDWASAYYFSFMPFAITQGYA